LRIWKYKLFTRGLKNKIGELENKRVKIERKQISSGIVFTIKIKTKEQVIDFISFPIFHVKLLG